MQNVIWCIRQELEFKHYGVLGMHWGIRKDEDMSSFIGPMPKYEVGDMDMSSFIQERGGLYAGDSGIVGRFGAPRDYGNVQQINAENKGITDLGMSTAFDHDAWNQAEERDRLGVIDYVMTGPCKAMNSLLRGDTATFEATCSRFNYDPSAVERSIDGMTKILNNTKVKRDMITDRRLPSSALSSFLGISEDMLKDRKAMGDFIGSRIKDEGFFSTSMISDAKTCSKYGDVKIHTYIPEGTQAMYMEEPACLNPLRKGDADYRNVYQKSYNRNLYEICLNRGSVFKVSGIEMDDDDKITDIFLDVIGQYGRDD